MTDSKYFKTGDVLLPRKREEMPCYVEVVGDDLDDTYILAYNYRYDFPNSCTWKTFYDFQVSEEYLRKHYRRISAKKLREWLMRECWFLCASCNERVSCKDGDAVRRKCYKCLNG